MSFAIPKRLRRPEVLVCYQILMGLYRRNMLDEMLSELPERYERIIRMRTDGKDLSCREIGKHFGLSGQRVSAIEKEALYKIRRKIIKNSEQFRDLQIF